MTVASRRAEPATRLKLPRAFDTSLAASPKGLGRWQASALAISFVVGTGILILPTLAVETAGPNGSLVAWIVMTALAAPLIAIFAKLGSRYPSHDGISEYCTEAFGSWSKLGVHLCLLSALVFGMPAMLWITAGILSHLFGVGSTSLWAHLTLGALCLNNLNPIRKSTIVSVVSSVSLLIAIACVIFSHPDSPRTGFDQLVNLSSSDLHWGAFWRTSVLIFFAYVGWESLTLCTRDLQSPEKDVSFVYWGSFAAVGALYLLLAFVISGVAPAGSHPEGILELIPRGPALAVIRFLITAVLLANLNAWILGGTRQLQQSFRYASEHFPSLQSMSRIHVASGVPRRALGAYFGLLTLFLLALDLKLTTISGFIALSSQNWALLYAGPLLYFAKRAQSQTDRITTAIASLSFLVLISAFSWKLIIDAVYLLISLMLAKKLTRSSQSK